MKTRLVRRWEARAPKHAVQEWLSGFREKMLPHLKGISGCLGVSVQVSSGDEPHQIVVLTYWDGTASLSKFAGPKPGIAVLPNWAAKILPDHDDFATHHDEVLLETF